MNPFRAFWRIYRAYRLYRLFLVILAVAGAAGWGKVIADSASTVVGRADRLTGGGCANVRVVKLDKRRYRHILDHVWDAVDKGKPLVLHIDRDGADENREQSLRGIPTRRGYDRDEYPVAMSEEGGKDADVRYVRYAENRSAGSAMSNQLEHLPEGACFRFQKRPK